MIDGTFVDDMLSLYPLMHVLLTRLHWESKCRKNVQCIFWFKLGYGMFLTFEISIIVRIVRWDPVEREHKKFIKKRVWKLELSLANCCLLFSVTKP